MQRALAKAGILNPIPTTEDGQEVIDYLSGMSKFSDREKYPVPALIFWTGTW
jgi:hypothetical protein